MGRCYGDEGDTDNDSNNSPNAADIETWHVTSPGE